MKNEMIGGDSANYEEADVTMSDERIDLPIFEFGASEDEIMQALADTIEKIPLDDQEHYWQIMDNDALEVNDKINLINDLLKRYNGDIRD